MVQKLTDPIRNTASSYNWNAVSELRCLLKVLHFYSKFPYVHRSAFSADVKRQFRVRWLSMYTILELYSDTRMWKGKKPKYS
jgi:hypothetical protein